MIVTRIHPAVLIADDDGAWSMINSESLSTTPVEQTSASWNTLSGIDQSSFALQAPALDRGAVRQTLLNEQISLAYGAPCSPLLLEGLAAAVERSPSSFYTILEVTRANIVSTMQDWLSGNPLGEISEELAAALIDDISTDVCRFIVATRSRLITLRLVLELESGCDDFSKLMDSAQTGDRAEQIEKIIARLEYGASYLLHCDDDMVNQIKTYVGAPTIALHHSQLRPDLSLDRWFEIFRGGDPALATVVENLLAAGNSFALETLGRQLERDIAQFQLELPGIGKPGTQAWQFLPGRPHIYFGAQEKIEGKLGFATPKGLLHAKPAIWSTEPGARRFTALMDSPTEIQIEDLLD